MDKWVGRVIITLIVFAFVAMAASDIWGPRKAEECSKLCAPAPVLECGRTIVCVLSPVPSTSNPCPGGDCKDGSR